ncbi:MAG: MraY family glycosyltransferase [Candidatus Bruticola sp.]
MSVRAQLAVFLLGFLYTLLLVPLVKRLAVCCGALDKPNARKVHHEPIPLWGGLGVAGGYFLAIISVICVSSSFRYAVTPIMVSQLTGMTLGGLIILAVGMIDDRYGMPAKVKLALQLVTGLVMFYFDIRIDYITVPGLGVIFLSTWQSILVTLFWIAGITNALNLIDGLDGLLAGVSLTVASVFFAVSLLKGQFVIALVMACLAGCSLGFLRYNFNPAQIFMGDTGSLFFGLMFAGWSIIGLLKSTATFAFLLPIFLMAVPIFDTAFAILRRLLSHKPIFQADKGHLHHRLLSLGLSQRQVVLIIYAINTVFGLCGLAIFYWTCRGE